MGSDGIFDKLNNEDVSNCVWNSCNLSADRPETHENKKAKNEHE
jgi:hypothetical protein